MRKVLTILMFLVCFAGQSQDWMTNLEIAERLALFQNKLLLVVWENAFYQKTPAILYNEQGKEVLIEDSYNSPVIDSLVWAHFVPVVLSEDAYPDLYAKIKDRSYDYIQKFNDDSMKIMDVNGNILNKMDEDVYLTNLSKFIGKYALDVSLIKNEYINYRQEKNFYSAFYLAAKYMDFAFFLKEDIRPEVTDLSLIYLEEALEFLNGIPEEEDKKIMLERIELLEIQSSLLTNKPKKVLRQLNRIDTTELDKANEKLLAFLYFSAYRMLNDEDNASQWRSKMSMLDLKKIMQLINHTDN